MSDATQTDLPGSPANAPAGQTPPAWKASLSRIVRQPRFVGAAVVLLISAVGLNAAAELMQLHFRKVAVPLPIKSLDDESEGIPPVLGPWLRVRDDTVSSEVEAALGTKQYVFRDYVDTRVVRNAAEKLREIKSDADRARLLGQWQGEHPDGVMRMAVTYYTGLVDTVAHVPDRCYVADGFEPSAWEFPTIDFVKRTGPLTPNASPDAAVAVTPVVVDVPDAAVVVPVGAAGSGKAVTFRFVNFDDQTAKMRLRRNVSYLFHVNGEFQDDPLQVRARLQNLLEKHGYYAKVELMTSIYNPDKADDNTKAMGVAKDFLTYALPEVEARLPDWQKVKAGGK